MNFRKININNILNLVCEECQEKIKNELDDIFDSIENKVNETYDFLDNIKDVTDLDKVSDCKNKLEELKDDLY